MTETAIVAAGAFTREQAELLKRTVCKGATDDELRLFMHVCAKTKLDPFTRQIYAIKRWSKDDNRQVMSIQTGVDGFRLIAERTGKYAGQIGPFWCGEDGDWSDVWLASTPPTAAKVGVHRSDFKEPLYAIAKWASYVQKTKEGKPSKFWATMPELMLAKCAEELALRRAFPQELSAVYGDDEMGQAEVAVEQVAGGALPAPASDPKQLLRPPEELRDPALEAGEKGLADFAKTADAEPPSQRINAISDAQRKRLFAIARECAVTDAELRKHLAEGWGLESSKDILARDYDRIVEWVREAAPPPASGATAWIRDDGHKAT